MQERERASQRRVVAAPPNAQMLEHEKCLLARVAPAERCRDPDSGRGKRGKTVGLGSEVVCLGPLVHLGEVRAAAPFDHEAAVDAAASGRLGALDAKRTRDLGDRVLQRGEEERRDQARLIVARARLTAARTREGAVPPACVRLATEPSSVSTR